MNSERLHMHGPQSKEPALEDPETQGELLAYVVSTIGRLLVSGEFKGVLISAVRDEAGDVKLRMRLADTAEDQAVMRELARILEQEDWINQLFQGILP